MDVLVVHLTCLAIGAACSWWHHGTEADLTSCLPLRESGSQMIDHDTFLTSRLVCGVHVIYKWKGDLIHIEPAPWRVPAILSACRRINNITRLVGFGSRSIFHAVAPDRLRHESDQSCEAD